MRCVQQNLGCQHFCCCCYVTIFYQFSRQPAQQATSREVLGKVLLVLQWIEILRSGIESRGPLVAYVGTGSLGCQTCNGCRQQSSCTVAQAAAGSCIKPAEGLVLAMKLSCTLESHDTGD
jgi:hypothetical protein